MWARLRLRPTHWLLNVPSLPKRCNGKVEKEWVTAGMSVGLHLVCSMDPIHNYKSTTPMKMEPRSPSTDRPIQKPRRPLVVFSLKAARSPPRTSQPGIACREEKGMFGIKE